MVVRRTGICRRDVILAVLILVLEREIRVLNNTDGLQKSGRVGNCYDAPCPFQVFRQAAFIPDIQLIAPIGNILDSHPAISIRHAKVRSVHRNHRAAHFRMNIAEEKTHPGTVELNRLAGPGFVKSKVKPLAVEQRENIVQEWIPIGKLDGSSHLSDQDMWIKTLVDLCDLRSGMA